MAPSRAGLSGRNFCLALLSRLLGQSPARTPQKSPAWVAVSGPLNCLDWYVGRWSQSSVCHTTGIGFVTLPFRAFSPRAMSTSKKPAWKAMGEWAKSNSRKRSRTESFLVDLSQHISQQNWESSAGWWID